MSDLMIRLAQLPSDFPQIYQVRQQVFQVEQGVDATLEFDGLDEQAEHLLALQDGQAIGTARMRYLNPEVVKLERLAVLAAARGQGIGKQLMEMALAILRDRQVGEVRIHAQTAVQAFYDKLGFVPEGEIFEEAGIPHVKMSKHLK
ncbi:GNAT family N-acetyltransferase [Pantanalinema sp. GBBB05]|uniref:GNAT family N-acetyltransferase n=1 Tax=Pantanalinema sp. GBBB05 TaxID=2604139 RepID=UPI001D1C3EDB|nr:GNAT family N-acetyltransferase [Pantanalinema sp. GBBB05]